MLFYFHCEIGEQKGDNSTKHMETLLHEIKEYWTTRTEGYSEVNQKELEGMQKEAWLEVLTEQFPDEDKDCLQILDVGCGPGFFTRILAEAGYRVTAVDYTPGMLKKARENTGAWLDRITFMRMDAQNLEFEDNTFDVVISRNLTWNLEHPRKAYQEWHRVLKPNGVLLNFDANWYGYLYDEKKREAYEQDRKNVQSRSLEDHYLCTDIDAMEQIALQVPLSHIIRPQWDIKVMKQLGFTQITYDESIWKRVWSEEERLNYASTPMFMVTGCKGKRSEYEGVILYQADYSRVQEKASKTYDERKERINKYWGKRSMSFMEQRRQELHSSIADRWLLEIQRLLPEKKAGKILDVGCGSGFFPILLAMKGYSVTGVDLSPEMIENAKNLAREEGASCRFHVMDAEKLDFADATFDVVISRNLTWTLPNAEKAYQEWRRVLKQGGILLNFDANYGAVDFSDYSQLPEEHAHRKMGDDLLRECEEIKRQLPISSMQRPGWDLKTLEKIGFRNLYTDMEIGKRIYIETDEFYNPTPIFLIKAQR